MELLLFNLLEHGESFSKYNFSVNSGTVWKIKFRILLPEQSFVKEYLSYLNLILNLNTLQKWKYVSITHSLRDNYRNFYFESQR